MPAIDYVKLVRIFLAYYVKEEMHYSDRTWNEFVGKVKGYIVQGWTMPEIAEWIGKQLPQHLDGTGFDYCLAEWLWSSAKEKGRAVAEESEEPSRPARRQHPRRKSRRLDREHPKACTECPGSTDFRLLSPPSAWVDERHASTLEPTSRDFHLSSLHTVLHHDDESEVIDEEATYVHHRYVERLVALRQLKALREREERSLRAEADRVRWSRFLNATLVVKRYHDHDDDVTKVWIKMYEVVSETSDSPGSSANDEYSAVVTFLKDLADFDAATEILAHADDDYIHGPACFNALLKDMYRRSVKELHLHITDIPKSCLSL